MSSFTENVVTSDKEEHGGGAKVVREGKVRKQKANRFFFEMYLKY